MRIGLSGAMGVIMAAIAASYLAQDHGWLIGAGVGSGVGVIVAAVVAIFERRRD